MLIKILLSLHHQTKTYKIMKTIITNKELYNELVVSVDVNNIKNVTDKSFYANLQIELANGEVKEIDGEFGYNDYQEEFGFIFSK